jgi:gluconolactonase
MAGKLLVGLAAACACVLAATAHSAPFPIVGSIQRERPALDALLDSRSPVQRLAHGLTWAEGPVWVRDGDYLLVSDVPQNSMYRWSESNGISLFLRPSGLADPDMSIFREPGSNGLIAGDRPGTILMADSGSRAIARLDLASKTKTLLATSYQGKKLNSPNDLFLARDGSIWFTDPPYGLKDIDKSAAKESAFNGVYRLMPDGEVRLVDDRLTFPNGVLLSPDQRTLYVSQSDPENAVIYAYSLDAAGNVAGRKVFAEMTALVKKGLPGLPDGMCMDAKGNIFTSGPGGIHILTPNGVELGVIKTDKATSNCTFGEDGRTLFLTSTDAIVRVRTKTKGLGF